jgi:hypothetical protein
MLRKRTGDGKTGIGNGGHALIGPYGLGLGSLLWRGHGLPMPLALAHGGFAPKRNGLVAMLRSLSHNGSYCSA